jgi:hypothetical protein
MGCPTPPQALSAAKAAGRVVRPFRSVDLDGDGVPDEPAAITAVKGVGSSLTSTFRSKKRSRQDAIEPLNELSDDNTASGPKQP